MTQRKDKTISSSEIRITRCAYFKRSLRLHSKGYNWVIVRKRKKYAERNTRTRLYNIQIKTARTIRITITYDIPIRLTMKTMIMWIFFIKK